MDGIFLEAKYSDLIRQETFLLLLSCKCASKRGMLMNPKSERSQKLGVLKDSVVQQRKLDCGIALSNWNIWLPMYTWISLSFILLLTPPFLMPLLRFKHVPVEKLMDSTQRLGKSQQD